MKFCFHNGTTGITALMLFEKSDPTLISDSPYHRYRRHFKTSILPTGSVTKPAHLSIQPGVWLIAHSTKIRVVVARLVAGAMLLKLVFSVPGNSNITGKYKRGGIRLLSLSSCSPMQWPSLLHWHHQAFSRLTPTLTNKVICLSVSPSSGEYRVCPSNQRSWPSCFK